MSAVYIKSAASITCQDTFLKENLHEQIKGAPERMELIQPNYKEFISPAMIRRASKMMKMSLAASQSCLNDIEVEDLGAIIVGSGLGCLTDTEKFLKSSITSGPDSLIAPGAFIQSGHNAISGQIALLLKNQKYNMTHVQRGLSFEYALMDAILRIKEGDQHVLLGAVDEHIDLLNEVVDEMNLPELKEKLSEGCSFFTLGMGESPVEVVEIRITSTSDLRSNLSAIVEKSELTFRESLMNFVGFGNSFSNPIDYPHVDYTDLVGFYFTASAFGFHLAYDTLKNRGKSGDFCTVLNFSDQEFASLMILKHV